MRSRFSALTAHITRLNRHDPTKFTPLRANTARDGWRTIGLVRADLAAIARGVGGVGWQANDHGLFLPAAALDPEARAESVAAALAIIGARVELPRKRDELYPVLARWGEAPLFAIDRAYVPVLGLKAFGVHVNGLVESGVVPEVWIATRSSDRGVEPNKRDNMIAGGQPFGLTLEQNLAKEAQEEAGIDEALIKTAKPAGILRYTMETEDGLKPDTLFLYDLAVPEDFTPHNQDGEISGFERMGLDDVLALVTETESVKFNVNLVLIDLLLRKEALGLDARQGAALAAALRPEHPF